MASMLVLEMALVRDTMMVHQWEYLRDQLKVRMKAK